jgi:hypothetical protein
MPWSESELEPKPELEFSVEARPAAVSVPWAGSGAEPVLPQPGAEFVPAPGDPAVPGPDDPAAPAADAGAPALRPACPIIH